MHVGGLLNPIPGKTFHLSPPHSIPPEENLCAVSLSAGYLFPALSTPPSIMLGIFPCLRFCQSYFHPPVLFFIPSSSTPICAGFFLNSSRSSIFLLSLSHFQSFVFTLMISDCQFEISGSDGFVRSSQVEEEEKVKPGEALDCIWTIRAPPRSKVTFISASLSFPTPQTLATMNPRLD